MNRKNIAIQGVLGSNHPCVAQQLYQEDIQLIECVSFDELTKSLISGDADEAIMAIENTIAGSIIPNYALINHNHLQIIGETYFQINHQLMALPGESIETIQEVCSHPMALLQCKDFFNYYPHIRLIEDIDTADVAKRIAENKLKNVAAIAPKMAADIFGLSVLKKDIQTIKENSTRFVILSMNKKNDNDSNKASINFQLDHKRGSLATILNVMSDCNLNLTKIQSLPVIETPWKYSFFVDVTFKLKKDYEKAIEIITIMAEKLKVLGTYKSGR